MSGREADGREGVEWTSSSASSMSAARGGVWNRIRRSEEGGVDVDEVWNEIFIITYFSQPNNFDRSWKT